MPSFYDLHQLTAQRPQGGDPLDLGKEDFNDFRERKTYIFVKRLGDK
jgi:hypothetical protein